MHVLLGRIAIVTSPGKTDEIDPSRRDGSSYDQPSRFEICSIFATFSGSFVPGYTATLTRLLLHAGLPLIVGVSCLRFVDFKPPRWGLRAPGLPASYIRVGKLYAYHRCLVSSTAFPLAHPDLDGSEPCISSW